MKSIIERSAYCIILVIMCYMAIGFIQMNIDVNKVNEVSKYVQDYMEVHGKSTGDDAAGYTLDAATLDHINSHVSRYGMTAAVTYDTATSGNVYYKLELKYALKMPFLNLNANHTYDAIARTPKTA